MSSSAHREIVDALDRLRSGATALTSEQYVRVLDALEHVSSVLHLAPRGADPVATGVWYHHERGPALAALADALRPEGAAAANDPQAGANPSDPESVQAAHIEERRHNAAVIRALQDSIQNL